MSNTFRAFIQFLEANVGKLSYIKQRPPSCMSFSIQNSLLTLYYLNIITANPSHLTRIKPFRSKLVSRNTKLKL